MNNKELALLVIGYFGYQDNQIDGQTIKTRNIYQLILSRYKGGKVSLYDTQNFKKSRFDLFTLLRMLWNSKILIYLPGQHNLRYIFPIIYIVAKVRNINIIHVAVGGWLNDFLNDNPIFIRPLKSVKSVFVESTMLCKTLTENHGFTNVGLLPNFRIHSFLPSKSENFDFKVVFMARVCREKGIDTVFQYADHFGKNDGKMNRKLLVDFYGPIQASDETYFNELIMRYPNVNYRGVINPEEVHNTLNEYDVLVLPTYYEGEGFPGTILDAYIAGIPVVVSNWKFLPEYVEVGKTGFIFDLDRQDNFFKYLDLLATDRILLNEMKEGAYQKSMEYSSEKAWEIIMTKI